LPTNEIHFAADPQNLREDLMKPPVKRLSDLKGGTPSAGVYAPPTPKVSRQKKAKVLSAAERAAFLASRPDLAKPKG
jgi:hypothetical protein